MTRNPLIYAASIAVLVCAAAVWMVAVSLSSSLAKIGTAADSLATLPTVLDKRVESLQSTVTALPDLVLPPVLKRVDRGIEKADAQITALRTEVLQRVDTLEHDANARTGEALATIQILQQDVQPVLENAASIEAHADKAVVDLHPQLLGLVAASKVTMGQTAQTMREVERAAPALLEDARGIGKSADGIAADVHQITSDIARPKSFWGKVKAFLESAGKVGARFL